MMLNIALIRNITIRFFPIAVFFLIQCTDSLDRSPFVSRPVGNDIDAVSSASKKFAITGGTIGAHNVSIGIWMMSASGDVWIRLGHNDSTWHFEESLNKNPNYFRQERTNIYSLSNLIADSTYHIWVIGVSGIDTAIVHTSFKTKPD